ncbi:MFS transporter [Gryllotalpicola protaetiae]|uniref:MFS transporter n=2 Tax=Gryllotalpicola protaetiae TaxID=2419771 RepID=A0A387BU26_9MICO|nr:MFS transporter [Gryllotalpicola protaetiae]
MTTMTAESRTAGRAAHHAGFWIIAVAFLFAMAFSTVPTPLYPIYEQRDGFPGYVVTIVFAAYAVGVMVALYLAGHVSDWLGRRRIVLAAVGVEALAAVMFLFWNDLSGLLVARFVSGVGIGMLTATATAYLAELRAVSHPDEDGATAGTVATVINTGGLALGPLLGGLIAQFLPAPVFTPFAIFLGLLAVTIVFALFVPETVDVRASRRPYAPQKVSIPDDARATFGAAAIGAAAAFSVFGFFTALTASIVIGLLHIQSHLVAGVVVFAVMGASAVSQFVFARVERTQKLRLGVGLMVVGLGLVAIVGLAPSLALFLVAGVIAGAGVGLVFTSSIGVAAASARPDNRGEVLAAMFLAAYAGLTIPVIAVGVALAFFPIPGVLVGFALAVLAIVIATAVPMLRRR